MRRVLSCLFLCSLFLFFPPMPVLKMTHLQIQKVAPIQRLLPVTHAAILTPAITRSSMQRIFLCSKSPMGAS